MPTQVHPAIGAKTTTRVAWTLSGLVIAFLLFDSIIKLIKIEPVVESFRELGFPDSLARGIGAMELAIVVLYVIPRTAVFGTILLTGLLGGAVASHLRLGDPLFSHVLFGVYVGLMAWGGLYLRDERLRALVPLRAG
jgi:DoxX-like family